MPDENLDQLWFARHNSAAVSVTVEQLHFLNHSFSLVAGDFFEAEHADQLLRLVMQRQLGSDSAYAGAAPSSWLAKLALFLLALIGIPFVFVFSIVLSLAWYLLSCPALSVLLAVYAVCNLWQRRNPRRALLVLLLCWTPLLVLALQAIFVFVAAIPMIPISWGMTFSNFGVINTFRAYFSSLWARTVSNLRWGKREAERFVQFPGDPDSYIMRLMFSPFLKP